MSTRIVGAFVFLSVAVFLIPPVPEARGCAIAPLPGGGSIDVTSESAVIVWDSTNKMEHFIRTASFAGSSAEFGFLVPTPSKPELHESDARIFDALYNLTLPRVIHEERTRYTGFGWALLPTQVETRFAAVGSAMPSAAAKATVDVVETKTVGGFDAAVLQANNAESLRKWLDENGYDARPSLTEWFQWYIDNKWYITAFKVSDKANKGNAAPSAYSTISQLKPVRISFATEKPFYPYREPKDRHTLAAGAAPTPRTLRVYFLGDVRYDASRTDGIQSWQGRTVWANRLNSAQLSGVWNMGKLPKELENTPWYFTEFEDQSAPRNGTDELYFAASGDQSPVERPPHIVVDWKDRVIPLEPFVAVFLVAITYVGWRRFRPTGAATGNMD